MGLKELYEKEWERIQSEEKRLQEEQLSLVDAKKEDAVASIVSRMPVLARHSIDEGFRYWISADRLSTSPYVYATYGLSRYRMTIRSQNDVRDIEVEKLSPFGESVPEVLLVLDNIEEKLGASFYKTKRGEPDTFYAGLTKKLNVGIAEGGSTFRFNEFCNLLGEVLNTEDALSEIGLSMYRLRYRSHVIVEKKGTALPLCIEYIDGEPSGVRLGSDAVVLPYEIEVSDATIGPKKLYAKLTIEDMPDLIAELWFEHSVSPETYRTHGGVAAPQMVEITEDIREALAG